MRNKARTYRILINGEQINVRTLDELSKIIGMSFKYTNNITRALRGIIPTKDGYKRQTIEIIEDFDNREKIIEKQRLRSRKFYYKSRGKDIPPEVLKRLEETKFKKEKKEKPKKPKKINKDGSEQGTKKLNREIKKLNKVSTKTLKDNQDNYGGKNNDELTMMFYSVAQKMIKKFQRNSEELRHDMVADAIIVCHKQFCKNADSDKNLFAYLSEIIKRSFAMTQNKWNRLGTKGNISMNSLDNIPQ